MNKNKLSSLIYQLITSLFSKKFPMLNNDLPIKRLVIIINKCSLKENTIIQFFFNFKFSRKLHNY